MNRYPLWKRAIDLTVASTVLVVTAPLCLVALALVWLQDRGDPIFRQERFGEHSSIIRVAKIRTMQIDTPNAPSADAPATVTRIGAILRRLNIDEVPQLLSVLRGDMALVGPRPCLPSQTSLQELRRASNADACRPGLTGWAQIHSYDGMSESHKAEFDAEYAAKISLLFDLRIIAATPRYFVQPPPKY